MRERSHVALLRYDGVNWTAVSVPLATVTNNDTLLQIVATGPDGIWVSGRSSAATATSTGLQIASLLLRYDGRAWSQVTPNIAVSGINAASIVSISVASDGTLWAAGGASNIPEGHGSAAPLFWRYDNGAWSALWATSGK